MRKKEQGGGGGEVPTPATGAGQQKGPAADAAAAAAVAVAAASRPRGGGRKRLEQRLVLATAVASCVAVQLWLAFPLSRLSFLYHLRTPANEIRYNYLSSSSARRGTSSGADSRAAVGGATNIGGHEEKEGSDKSDGDHGRHPSFWDVPESFRLHEFPRWGSSTKGRQQQPQEPLELEGGIQLSPLLEFLDDLLSHPERVPRMLNTFVYVWGATAVGGEAEVPPPSPSSARNRSAAELRRAGIWVSERIRTRALEQTHNQVYRRLSLVEPVLQRAWTFLSLRWDSPEARERWPLLVRTIIGAKPNAQAGFPILFYHGDFRSCNHRNYKGNASVPVLTTCAHVLCNHSVPFPNYGTIKDSRRSSRSWDAAMEKQEVSHPWSEKIRQVVWRGSLTGRGSLNRPSPRILLGLFAGAHRSHPLIDIGIHKVHAGKNFSSDLLAQVVRKPPIPYGNFSNYMAILDVDGNSWSSRFGKLLCTNSLIMKVEPMYVDYFYKYLAPWRHYVPVRSDLRDLLEKIEWSLDQSNERRVRQIVSNANQWCRVHMTQEGVIRDMLDVLNSYVALLDQGDALWTDTWAESKALALGAASRWEMRRLEEFIPA
jgi:hypothetical protein